MIRRLKDIDGRKYHPETKSWMYPASPCSAGDIARAVQAVGGTLFPDEHFGQMLSAHVQAMGVILGKREPKQYDTKTPDMHHQDIGLTMIETLPGCYLQWQMGTGKSKSIVDAVCTLGMWRTLIVCPRNVIPEWHHQFEEHGDGSALVVHLKRGSAKLNRKRAERYNETDGRVVYVVNYESVWRKALAKWVMEQQWSLIVCDEVHRLKDQKRSSTKFLIKLADSSLAKRVGLSGTPISNVPTDLFAQMLFIDKGLFGTSLKAFQGRYCIYGGFQKSFEVKCECVQNGVPSAECDLCKGAGVYEKKRPVQVVGYKNLDHMGKRLFYVCHRITKKQALDLPPEVDQEIAVEFGKEGRKVYQEIDESFVAKVGSGEITVANALTECLRLQQLLGGAAALDDGTSEVVDRSKGDVLKEVLETIGSNHKTQREPAVVFCRFHHDLDVVHEVCKELGILSAELSGRSRQTEVWKQDTGSMPVIAVQISSGGEGVNLVRACYAIYYSIGFSMKDYLQARSRLHRKGQERSVTHVHLVVQSWNGEQTIDQRVFASIRRKMKYADKVLNEDSGSLVADVFKSIQEALNSVKRS